MAKLTTDARKHLPAKAFALPGGRYPIPDANHARNALSRISQFGNPEEKSEVRSKVHSNFPGIGMAGGGSIWADAQKYAGGGEQPLDFDARKQANGRAPAASPDDADEPDDAAATEQPVLPKVAAPPAQVFRGPSSSKGNVLDIRDQLEKYLKKQSDSTDSMQELADNYKDQLSKEGSKANLSPLNALSDAYYGTNFAKTFGKPPTEAEQTEANLKAQEGVAKAVQPVTGDLLKEYGIDNSAVGKEQAALYRGLNSDRKTTAQQEKALDTMEEHMAKAMNPLSSVYGGGANNLGNRLARARSAMALIRQHPNLDLDPRERKEFALATATLLSNQNRVPYELVQDLVPKNFAGDYAKAVEYFANHPEDTGSQEFIKRMINTIQKEQETATEQVKAIQWQQSQGFYPLAIKRPERFAAHVQSGAKFLNVPGLDSSPVAPQLNDTKLINGVQYQKVKGGWQKVK